MLKRLLANASALALAAVPSPVAALSGSEIIPQNTRPSDPMGAGATVGGPMIVVHAANNTAMAGMTTSIARFVRDGYALTGDGGRAEYTTTSTTCSLNSGAGDSGSQIGLKGVGSTYIGCALIDWASVSGVATPELFGAKADGVTDDSAALLAAVYARAALGGVVQLSCNKNYFIGQSVMLGAPGVTVQQCWHRPTLFSNSVGFADTRFLGSTNTVGHVVRAASATISIGMGGGLRDILILQQGVTVPMPDASAYAGTAVAVAPGGKGSAAHLDDVFIIGAAVGFDGSNGATPAELRHVDIDATAGLIAGQSAGSSVYDDVDVSVFGTQDFAGYPINNVTGNGTTTTVTFTVPSGSTTSQFPNNDLIKLPGVTSSAGQLYSSVSGYKITSQSVSGTTATVRFASTVNTANTPVTATGNLTEYTRQFLRAGTGFLFGSTAANVNQGCDDTHLGRVGNFGSAIGFDFQCNGIANVDHIWADNNGIGVRVGRYANGNDPGKQVSQLHFGSVFTADTGGIGFQVNSPSISALSSVLIDKLSVTGISSDCTQFAGQVSIGNMHVEGCFGYGANVTPGT